MQQADFSLPVKHFVELLVAGDYRELGDIGKLLLM
jgi:hypothetical protein